MKIAYILDCFPSLTETFIARDIEALRRHGLDIEVFALQSGEGAHPISLPTPLDALWWRGAWEKLTATERTEFFKGVGAAWWQTLGSQSQTFQHIHAGWASHPALIAWGASELSGLPWSFSGHARDIFVVGGDLAAKARASRFAAVCTHAAENYLHGVAPESKAKVIYAPHGIDTKQIAFRQWTPPDQLHILAVGRLVEKKGFHVLLDAMAILKSQDFPFEATILGDGPLRQNLAARRDKLQLQHSVHLPGAVSPSKVMARMVTAGCLVVPSLIARDGDRDGLPNVVLEAAACGLPIVATRAGAIEEFVDESTGRLCHSGNAESLASAIGAVMAEAADTQARCVAARQRVISGFDLMHNASYLAQAFTR